MDRTKGLIVERGDSAMASCSDLEKGDRAGVPPNTEVLANGVPIFNNFNQHFNITARPTNKTNISRIDHSGSEDLSILFIGFNLTSTIFKTALYHSNILKHTVNFDNKSDVLKSGIGFVEIPKNGTIDQRTLMSNTIQNIKTSNPRLLCFNGSHMWKMFINELLPGSKTDEVFYGIQNVHLKEITSSFYILPSTLPATQHTISLFTEIQIIKDKLKTDQDKMRFEIVNEKNKKSDRDRENISRKRTTATDNDLTTSNPSKMRKTEIIKKEEAQPQVQHRLSGGGIDETMLKDPSDTERMNRVKRWVNEQDFDRATPEPDHPLTGNRDRLDLGLGSDLYAKLPISALPVLNATQWPHGSGLAQTIGLGGGLERLLDQAYLTNIIQPNTLTAGGFATTASLPQTGLQSALLGAAGSQLQNAWPYPNMSSLYRLPISPYDWNKASTSALDSSRLLQQSGSDLGARAVIPFVPLIQAAPTQFLLPGSTQTQPVIYPPGFGPAKNDKNP